VEPQNPFEILIAAALLIVALIIGIVRIINDAITKHEEKYHAEEAKP
jgi:hypothetical protein